MNTIVETQDGKIFTDGDGCKIFCSKSGCGYELQFNVNYIKDENLHWFSQVVGRQYKEAIEHVQLAEKRNIRNTIKHALGIK